jgi:hypothetical protein
MIIVFLANPEFRQRLSIFSFLGFPTSLLIFSIVFLFALGIASGVGMWKGRKWGWYLGTFYYIYSITRNANALLAVSIFINSMSPGETADMSRALT